MNETLSQYLNGLITKDELFKNIKSEPYYDYYNQAWTVEGHYLPCNHPDKMNCHCFAKLNYGQPTNEKALFYPTI